MGIKDGVNVYSIWAVTEGEEDAPWLVASWDEWSVDDNPEGWREAVEKARAENFKTRTFVTTVDFEAIQRGFMPTAIASSPVRAGD